MEEDIRYLINEKLASLNGKKTFSTVSLERKDYGGEAPFGRYHEK
jgi:hypothetical protein